MGRTHGDRLVDAPLAWLIDAGPSAGARPQPSPGVSLIKKIDRSVLFCHRPEFVYAMNMRSRARDTIPRLQQIVPHMRDQLTSLRDGSTFEHARRRYAGTVDRLDSQGLGRRTASRVGDQDQYWSPTREVLDEAMRLGFVERQQLPSSRRYVYAHRHRQYTLTKLGLQAAEEAETDMAAFCDRLAAAVYDNHSYFRAFIDTLQAGPIGCPEVAEGEVEESRRSGRNTEHWVEIASQRIPHQTTSGDNKARIREAIVAVVRHRFGQTPERLPTSKQMAEALNDAYIEAALSLCGLSIGAIDLTVMTKWGSQLMLLDESRYVPAFTGQNIIWLAADVSDNGDVRIQRRTLQNYERSVADAVVAAYKYQAATEKTSLRAPYLPIYRVRAQAAFERQVTRALVDMVIERLAAGSMPDPHVQVWLHLGNTRQPDSEPIYRRGGNRRYEITIQSPDI